MEGANIAHGGCKPVGITASKGETDDDQATKHGYPLVARSGVGAERREVRPSAPPQKPARRSPCCEECIEDVQLAITKATSVDSSDRASAIGGGNITTYGELAPLGFAALARRLRLCHTDRFVDLGSGTGRLVFQAVRDFGVQQSIGVEFVVGRHEQATSSLAALPTACASRVKLLLGDCAHR